MGRVPGMVVLGNVVSHLLEDSIAKADARCRTTGLPALTRGILDGIGAKDSLAWTTD